MFVFLYGNNGKACVALTGTSMFPSLVSTVSCEKRLLHTTRVVQEIQDFALRKKNKHNSNSISILVTVYHQSDKPKPTDLQKTSTYASLGPRF